MLLERLIQDILYGIRQLRRNSLFTLTAIVTLAIGIGANTTVFTVADALLFHDPVGVANPDRLVDIGVSFKGRGFGSGSYPNYQDIVQRATTLDGVYAHPRFPRAMSLGSDSVFGFEVTSNFFSVLGAVPSVGRFFKPGDPPDNDGVVLSRRFWTRRFNGDAGVIGQTLRLNGKPFTVVGVAEEGFQGTGIRSADLWIPLQEGTNRNAAVLVMGARLKPGISLPQASAELATIGRTLAEEYPVDNKDKGLLAAALSPVPGETAPVTVFLTLLGGIVIVVLTIACANISSVLLSQAAGRRREMAVRIAIGAGRARIVSQLLTETILLFLAGAAAGMALARGMTSLLVSQLPSLPFPINVPLELNGRAILFVTTLSLFTALLSGLAPAFHASKGDVLPALKDDTARFFGKLWLRHAFVVAQVALSVLLVVIGSLFARALQHAISNDPGFDPKGVELATIDPAMARYNASTAPLLLRDIVDRVRALPDVEEATAAAVLPGGFEGVSLGGLSAQATSADWNIVEPGYFATLHMPLIAGRDFNVDDRSGSEFVVILGEGAARKFWPAEDPIGKSIDQVTYSRGGPQRRMLKVIGVARDPKFGSIVDGTSGTFAYVPFQQQYLPGLKPIIAARSKRGVRLTEEIRDVLAIASPDLPIITAQTAEEYASLALAPQRVVVSLAGSLGMVGLLLAAIGIYGVISYMVTCRSREIGIRVALGATWTNVVSIVLRQGLLLVAIGIAAGLTLAAGAGPLLASFLFGIPPLDALVFFGAAAVFTVTGLIACYVPIRRATQIDPMNALRNE